MSSVAAATGYLHPTYAASLAEFGTPHYLPRSAGWILTRSIPGHPDRDGVGCYPLFTCERWRHLPEDLADLKDILVALSAVVDPFADVTTAFLAQCFGDLVRPFKSHFVVDLQCFDERRLPEHHRRNTQHAMRRVSVERVAHPASRLDDWMRLYSTLIERHSITGMARFSRQAFLKQLGIPGLVAFRAAGGETTVGMTLWYLHGDRAYYHLGAYSDAGYLAKASYALFSTAIEHFTAIGLRWLALGGGAGARDDTTDGLSRFKRGWATETRTAYLCGRIFDHARYRTISEDLAAPAGDYFPLYRAGEFL